MSRNLGSIFLPPFPKKYNNVNKKIWFWWQSWNCKKWIIIFFLFYRYVNYGESLTNFNIKPFGFYSVCEWFARVYTLIKSKKLKFIPILNNIKLGLDIVNQWQFFKIFANIDDNVVIKQTRIYFSSEREFFNEREFLSNKQENISYERDLFSNAREYFSSKREFFSNKRENFSNKREFLSNKREYFSYERPTRKTAKFWHNVGRWSHDKRLICPFKNWPPPTSAACRFRKCDCEFI